MRCMGLVGRSRWLFTMVSINQASDRPQPTPNQNLNRPQIDPQPKNPNRPREVLYLAALFFQGGAGGGITGFINNTRQWLWIPVSQVCWLLDHALLFVCCVEGQAA